MPIVTKIVIVLVAIAIAHGMGFEYARQIATGERKVKKGKDFMYGKRKGDK